jgi:hypothetical protein
MFVDMQSPKLCKSQHPHPSLVSHAERIIFCHLTTAEALLSPPSLWLSVGEAQQFSLFFILTVLKCYVCLGDRD